MSNQEQLFNMCCVRSESYQWEYTGRKCLLLPLESRHRYTIVAQNADLRFQFVTRFQTKEQANLTGSKSVVRNQSTIDHYLRIGGSLLLLSFTFSESIHFTALQICDENQHQQGLYLLSASIIFSKFGALKLQIAWFCLNGSIFVKLDLFFFAIRS